VRCDLEHHRAVVADLLHRGQRRRPVDRPVERHQVIVRAAAVVVQVRRDHVLRHRFHRVDDVAVDVRVAEVEADADAETVEILFDEVDERARARQLVRDQLDGDLHAERLGDPAQFLDAASRRRTCVLRADAGVARLHPGDAQMRDEDRQSDPPRDEQRLLGLADRPAARAVVGARQ
jgi:hypothetical protein